MIAVLVIVGALLFYVLGGRAWLKGKPWTQGFFAWIEPYEIALWRKSETILFARFKQLVGIVLTILTQIGEIDLAPLMPFLPAQYLWVPAFLPLLITVVGVIDEWLRSTTTKPIEVVAVPEATAPPEVKRAVAEAEAANEAAVAVVEEAKAAKEI